MWWLSLAVRKGQQLPWIVSDALWARIEPLFPAVPRRADHPGRRRLDDRQVAEAKGASLRGLTHVVLPQIVWHGCLDQGAGGRTTA
jgi:transposase